MICEEIGHMKTTSRIIIVLVILATLLAVGCTGSSSEYSDGNTDENTDTAFETEPLEILDHHLENGENETYKVIGSAKAHKSLSYAEVKVKVYDEDGALISTFLDDIDNLEEGETWDFEVRFFVLGKEVDDYEIAVGSCR